MIHSQNIQDGDQHAAPSPCQTPCGSTCRQFVTRRKPIILKVGGDIACDEHALNSFAQQVLELKSKGKAVVIVHGGGPSISEALQREGIQYEFSRGTRVTNAEAMVVVQRTLCGEVNPRIVSELNRARIRSTGISGLDGHFVKCVPTDPQLGFVGEPTQLDPSMLSALLDNGVTPVVAPMAVDSDGKVHNVNADTFAGFLAASLQASALLLMTNVSGIKTRDGKTLEKVCANTFDDLVKNGSIQGGMTPKVKAALHAFREGVPRTVIVDGRVARSAIRALEGFSGVGTHVTAH